MEIRYYDYKDPIIIIKLTRDIFTLGNIFFEIEDYKTRFLNCNGPERLKSFEWLKQREIGFVAFKNRDKNLSLLV